MPTCIFCSKSDPEVSFDQQIHLSRALGFDRVLKNATECDDCNGLFGREVESYATDGELLFYRSILRIRRIAQDGAIRPPPDFRLGNFSILHSGFDRPRIEIQRQKRTKVSVELDPNTKRISMSPRFPNRRNRVSRLLSKILVESYAECFGVQRVFLDLFAPQRANALGLFPNPNRVYLPYCQYLVPEGHKPRYKIGLLSGAVDGILIHAGQLILAMPLTVTDFDRQEWQGFTRIRPPQIAQLNSVLPQSGELLDRL